MEGEGPEPGSMVFNRVNMRPYILESWAIIRKARIRSLSNKWEADGI